MIPAVVLAWVLTCVVALPVATHSPWPILGLLVPILPVAMLAPCGRTPKGQ